MDTPRPSEYSAERLAVTQLEKLQCEVEKLKLEIESLRSNPHWLDRAVKYIPTVTAFLALAGFWFSVYQFQIQQKTTEMRHEKEQIARLTSMQNELRRNTEAREREFRKPYWERQLSLYFDAAEAAATRATSQFGLKRKLAEDRFWQLYWGPLAVVEDAGMKSPEQARVEKAMVRFGHCLDGTDQCDSTELRRRSLSLAHTLRDSIGHSWDVKLADLKDSPSRSGSAEE